MATSTGTLNTQGGALLPTNNGGQPTSAFGAPTALNSFVNTLPNVPNPTPPPPKTLTVVTPATAKADVTKKQDTVNQVSTAVQTQTQNKLAALTPQTQISTEPNQTQQQTQTNAPAAGNTYTPPANATTVTLPNGTQGYYDSASQQLTTASGAPLTWEVPIDPNTGKAVVGGSPEWIDPNTGQPPPPQGTTTTGIPSTGDPTTDYINQQYQTNQTAIDQASAAHQQQLSQILNGTFPLTADQQQQVANLQAQFDQLKQLQQTANANYTGATTVLGIRSGREQYAPEIAQGQITAAISLGISKLAAIDMQASQAVATLKQGFLDGDYKIINQAYDDLTAAIQTKNDTLQKMQDTIKQQIDLQTSKVANQTAQLANATAKVTSLATSALQQSLTADGTIDLDELQRIATENGVDANVLYGAVQKEQQTEKLQQQGDSKFAADQLQAAATLANTKATTAKTYADINTINTANASTDAGSSLAGQANYKKLAPAQKAIVDGTNNLINALQSYKELYDSAVDNSGGKFFGEDAAKLASAYHSLIFQYSVAAGSGAIQKTDAEQIQKIIPDPTSVGGILLASIRAGKKGGESALDQQISKFTSNLKTYGITPTVTTSAPTVVPNPNGGEDIEITD